MGSTAKKIIIVMLAGFVLLHGGYWLLGKLIEPLAADPELDRLIEERMRERRIEWGIEQPEEPQEFFDGEFVG